MTPARSIATCASCASRTAPTSCAGDDAVAFTRVLETHTVLMDHGAGEPVEESLATWLSLLDHEEWRGRVREVRAGAVASSA